MSKKKKLIIAIIITLAVIGIIVAVLMVIKNKNKEKKVVNVESVEMLCTPAEYMEYNNTLYGYVDTSMEQKIYLTSTDVVEETRVKEGQQVKAGDVILVYDMTARELELEMQRAVVEQARVNVLVAERELEELKAIVPVEEKPEEPTTEETTPDVPVIDEPSVDDEEEEPGDTEDIEAEEPTPEETESTTESTDTTTETSETTTEVNEPSTENSETTTTEEQQGGGNEPTIGASALNDAPLCTNNPAAGEDGGLDETVEGEEEITYTKEELDKLIAEKESEIKSLNIAYQLEQVNLDLLEFQSENGEVLCNFDGVVTSVKDPEEAILNGEPYIIISGNEGCSVKASIGELSLGDISIGDEMELYCYENGMYYSGVISEIGDTPTGDGYYSTLTESFYPITITVADSEGLSMGMGMDVTKPTVDSDGTGAFYIPLAYVLNENGQYYVMIDNNGVLEKKAIKTGQIMRGDSIKVLGGLSMDDYIAFPHSSDAVEGVRTKKSEGFSMYY